MTIRYMKADSAVGYIFASLFGFAFGGPIGLIVSPIVLYICTKKNRTKNKPFSYWSTYGIILSPASWLLFILLVRIGYNVFSPDVPSVVSSVVKLPCSKWNTKDFFETATVADVTRCLKSGSNIEAKNENGSTPLHIAVEYSKSTDVLKFLIDGGANIEAKNKYGRTPLHTAAYKNTTGILKFLIDGGANIEAKDEKGSTPLHIAAALSSSPDKINIIIETGIDIESLNEYKWTALHAAAFQNKSPRIIKALLDGGANIEARDNGGFTPLLIAVEKILLM